MVLALDAQHAEQVDVGRGRTHEAVHDRVTGQHVVHQQRVHGRDVTVYRVVVHTVTVGIVFVAAGRTHHVVEYPCRIVVSLDGGLHVQHAAEDVTQVTIETLHVFIGIRYSQIVLV